MLRRNTHNARPMSLQAFHPIIAEWFATHVGLPTDVQRASWPAIASGQHTLIAAPTGSGKTLAAFLICLDRLLKDALACRLSHVTQIVYVSPLKALSHDIQKNLQEPLAQITQCALSAGYLVPPLRVAVRTGDTPSSDRQRMLIDPPHILITTPETLYLMLTAQKSRAILTNVRTVIVDEIHAVAGNKRGTHLALSLERLSALSSERPARIGLSATQRPLERVARFLTGGEVTANGTSSGTWVASSCHIVDMGQKREMDVRVEVPRDELGAIATTAMWEEIYDRLAVLAQEHRTTLVFVNTRRLAERVAHHLSERLGGDVVMAHHGSLSRKIRLSAEHRLKTGQLRVMVATASLELGIDIGHVDLVCQIGSPRAIATCLQRVGRAGHWVGGMPRARLFSTTRDDLVECAATVWAIRQGTLDPVIVPEAPVDILAQQMVAEVSAQEWHVDELYALYRRAFPYRSLSREAFDSVLHMVAEGYVSGRRRQYAHVFYDRVRKRVRPRKGARLAAITSGGAIPDAATYAVVAEPDGKVVGSVDEDFAVESLAGDIMLLGTTSWRIRGIETGKVRVEDAHGAPPNIPFWRGEAPSRTLELSGEVAGLREHVAVLLTESAAPNSEADTWLQQECGVDGAGAAQIVNYLRDGIRALGAVPTQQRVIAERFFDEAGGMQLVIHSPFGGRINRAWGLALRKRFCLNFDFELQAAATDDGLVLSLGEKHSFPLDSIFAFLHPHTVRDVLIQAVLASPLFVTRWRWNVSRALALLRFQRGKKVPLHIQRMRAEDLLGAAFPLATACQDNHVGDVPVPDHPLVQETLRDCLTEAMDIDGLTEVLERMARGDVACVAIESPTPSPFAHEILHANPYAFLDDAPLEERRARAVNLRQVLPEEFGGALSALDAETIAAVLSEAWPTVRHADDLEEVLHVLVWVPAVQGGAWNEAFAVLAMSQRAHVVEVSVGDGDETSPVEGWVATEHLPLVRQVFANVTVRSSGRDDHSGAVGKTGDGDEDEAIRLIVQGWMEVCGPITVDELSTKLCLPGHRIQQALSTLEGQGHVLQGRYRPSSPSSAREWCERGLLARMHRRTVQAIRREIEPVSASAFVHFLFRWQHCAPGTQLHDEAGLEEVIRQLAGFEAAAVAWESSLFRMRISNYRPELLDSLCLRGTVAWARFTAPRQVNAVVQSDHDEPHPVLWDTATAASRRAARVVPTSLAPIAFCLRDDIGWQIALNREAMNDIRAQGLRGMLSAAAQEVLRVLEGRGASFFNDLAVATTCLPSEVERALWELVAAGMVTADGFDNLRALIDPKRRNAGDGARGRRPRHSGGRWDRLSMQPNEAESDAVGSGSGVESSRRRWAKQLLLRYGVVFRDLLKRESVPVTWRELLTEYRMMEWRGEIRGGRFVDGFTGEQYALPQAVDALRATRRTRNGAEHAIVISAMDPLNLVGIILPGARVPAHSSKKLVFRDGQLMQKDDVVTVVS